MSCATMPVPRWPCALLARATSSASMSTPAPCFTDQGLIEGDAYETLRYRQRICPAALIFADVHVKHAMPLGAGQLKTRA